MERNGRFTFGWCISYRPFHNPPRKEVEAKIVKNTELHISNHNLIPNTTSCFSPYHMLYSLSVYPSQQETGHKTYKNHNLKETNLSSGS